MTFQSEIKLDVKLGSSVTDILKITVYKGDHFAKIQFWFLTCLNRSDWTS